MLRAPRSATRGDRFRVRGRRAAVVLLCAATGAVVVLAPVLWTAERGSSGVRREPSGLLSFHADPRGNSGLYVTRADGSGVRLVSGELAGHPFSKWSPDGRRLAFLSGSHGEGSLRVVGLGGGVGRRIGGHVVRGFSWSPDGRELAYESTNAGIWIASSTGRARARRLVTAGAAPVWSPDGRWIAYFAGRGSRLDIYKIRVRGGRPVQLVQHRAADYSPQWSPDGSLLAFISERDGNSNLYLVRSTGRDVRRLTAEPSPDEAFAWVPDGRRLVYVSYRDGADPLSIGQGNAEIYAVDVRTRNTQNLSRMAGAWDGDPTWSPDGAWIAFTRRTDHGELVVMRADGSDQRVLPGAVDSGVNDCCPSWQPRR